MTFVVTVDCVKNYIKQILQHDSKMDKGFDFKPVPSQTGSGILRYINIQLQLWYAPTTQVRVNINSINIILQSIFNLYLFYFLDLFIAASTYMNVEIQFRKF